MESSTLHEYSKLKGQLIVWLQSAAGLAAASDTVTGSDEHSWTVRELMLGLSNQVQDDKFKVAVVGEYSSGKSSLLNVLLRLQNPDSRKADGLLPTAITPTTAVITTLVYDETRSITITLDDGTTRRVSAEQLNSFLTEPTLRRRKFWWSSDAEENEYLAQRIRKVRVGCVSSFLGEGVELVDTPGIGSINEDHARITRDFTAEVDAALFLISVDPPMGEREMTFLQHIKTITDRCLFVQTKRDLGDRTENGQLVWQRREKEHRRRIGEVLGRTDFRLHCVSAYQAAQGLRRDDAQEFTDSGFGVLEGELQRFLVAERGVLRFAKWIKKSNFAINLIEDAILMQRQQLDAKMADTTAPIAEADDYIEWQAISQALIKSLASTADAAGKRLSEQKESFTNEVSREAQRELSLTSAEQLAKNPDRRLQVERSVVKSVQYHSSDLLTPIIDFAIVEAQQLLEETLGKEQLPKAFQQFSNVDFDWKSSSQGIDFSELVEVHTFIQETKRGGFGIVDFFLGSIKTEVTEYNLDKQRFTLMVEKAIEEAFRTVKSELKSTLKAIDGAVKSEMSRILSAARNAAEQQKHIQQQDAAECEKQLAYNQDQEKQVVEHRLKLNRISASIQPLNSDL